MLRAIGSQWDSPAKIPCCMFLGWTHLDFIQVLCRWQGHGKFCICRDMERPHQQWQYTSHSCLLLCIIITLQVICKGSWGFLFSFSSALNPWNNAVYSVGAQWALAGSLDFFTCNKISLNPYGNVKVHKGLIQWDPYRGSSDPKGSDYTLMEFLHMG